ncbi:MAG: hypothetical protein K1X66_03315 [Verrucomicrobiae bacterium]|nr:hypothetical protein [Verrucomicrobiae bacterium]
MPLILFKLKGETFTSDQLILLRKTKPFIYQLLTTPTLTTPLLERAVNQTLQSQQTFKKTENTLIRCNQLRLSQKPNTLIEIAETTFSEKIPDWAQIDEPLGPWLASQGYALEKKSITPLLFLSCDFLQQLFSTTQNCYGRSYQFQITSPQNMIYSVPTLEIWNPLVTSYSLYFQPTA